MTEELKLFKEAIEKNIAGLIAVCVIDIETGTPYLAYSTTSDFDADIAASYNLEVVKSKVNAIMALNIEDKLQDIIVNLEHQIHLTDISDEGSYIIYIAANSKKTNLALMRAVVKKQKTILNAVL